MISPVVIRAVAGDVTNVRPRITRNLVGELVAVSLSFVGAPPAGTVVLSGAPGINGEPAQTYLNLAATNTNNWYYPAVSLEDNTGAEFLYASGGTKVPTSFIVNGPLLLTVGAALTGAMEIQAIAYIRQ